MDPVTSIVTALVSGAAAGLQPTVTQAIKDGYASLKALLKRKYAHVSVEQLEQNPTSTARRDVVEEDLTKTDAAQDEELLRAAKALLDAIQRQAPETAATIGVDLEAIKGASLTIEHIIATGATATGVRAKSVETTGDITIRDVQTHDGGASPNR